MNREKEISIFSSSLSFRFWYKQFFGEEEEKKEKKKKKDQKDEFFKENAIRNVGKGAREREKKRKEQ